MVSSLAEEHFINRGEELELIEKAFAELGDQNRLLHTPIIDFFGVDGIGKTRMLQEVRDRGEKQGFHCIWVNANQQPAQFLLQWLTQVGPFQSDDRTDVYLSKTADDLYAQSVYGMKSLLKKAPVVVLVDEVDTDSTEEIRWIESMLYELIDLRNLFVVLASQQQVSFDKHRSVARKLISHPLKPFDQKACQSYLSTIARSIDPHIRDEIISWAHGFPLTLKVMSQIVQDEQLDPRAEKDQKRLITSLMDQVVDHGIFARVEPHRLNWCKAYISLLSIPRRFNLVILQKLTEAFAPSLRLAGKLEYMGLPRRINQGTDVLYWDMRRSGFTIDETVRRLFFRQQAIEQPERFTAIHRFLAALNKQFAEEVSGSDRVRYLREYLYHSTFVEDQQALLKILEETLLSIAHETPDAFIQFAEELRQDEEFKDALGSHLALVTNFVERTFKKEGE